MRIRILASAAGQMLALLLVLTVIPVAQSTAQSSVTINYGIVMSTSSVQKDARHAGGAVTGGLIGALIGPRRR